MNVTVLIPVLDRPERVEPLLGSLLASERLLGLIPVFLCNRHDRREVAAVVAAGVEPRLCDWRSGHGDYAKKMNLGFSEAETDWVFLGADDLDFHPGWADVAVETGEASGQCVVGTNDLGNSRVTSGQHSTHSLVSLEYGLVCGTIDDDTRLLHEGYHHNFVDDEFVQTAKFRSAYVHAGDAIVEHLHPHWGKGHMDATYRKGLKDFNLDRQIYNDRCRLWMGDAR